jgi:hypothetical protein
MAASVPFDWMAVMRRPIEPGLLLPGMVRRPGYDIGTRWLYQDSHMRSLGGDAGFETYDVVEGCVVERVSYSRNFPETPLHLVTLDNGKLAIANVVALAAYAGPAFAEGDIRAFDYQLAVEETELHPAAPRQESAA